MARQRPFRLTAPIVAEDELHAAVAAALDLLLLPPAEWTTFPAGHVPLPPQFAAKLNRLGLKRSWPDILVLHERLHGIELKRFGAGLSHARTLRSKRGTVRYVEGQRETFPRLERAGMRIAVCSSVDDVLDALGQWNIPLRRIAA